MDFLIEFGMPEDIARAINERGDRVTSYFAKRLQVEPENVTCIAYTAPNASIRVIKVTYGVHHSAYMESAVKNAWKITCDLIAGLVKSLVYESEPQIWFFTGTKV